MLKEDNGMGRFISNDELAEVERKYKDEIEKYMKRSYAIKVWKWNDEWVAEIEDLPGCMSMGDTREAALAGLDEARRRWFILALHAGVKPPPPRKEGDKNG